MAISPELQAKLDLAIKAQLKTVAENREKSLSAVSSRELDFTKEEDVNLYLQFTAKEEGAPIDRDAIVKNPEGIKTVYATVTGYHTMDDAKTVHVNSRGKEYHKRALYIDIAGGGSTMMFFNAEVEDFPGGVVKGSVVTTKAIAFKAGQRCISKGRDLVAGNPDAGSKWNLTEYKQNAYWAFNAFGHKTSEQELTIANSVKQLKTVLAEIEL